MTIYASFPAGLPKEAFIFLCRENIDAAASAQHMLRIVIRSGEFVFLTFTPFIIAIVVFVKVYVAMVKVRRVELNMPKI